MSVIAPRGRHRAPSKLSTTVNSTARVSAAVAVTGGIVASIAAPQAADAATGVASFSGTARAAAAAAPAQSVQAKQLLATVNAKPQLAVAPQAKQLVVKTKSSRPAQQTAGTEQRATTTTTQTQVRPRTSSVSRSQVRTAARPVSTQNESRPAPAPAPAPKAQPKPAPKPVSQPTVPAASGVAAIAQRYLGTPYVYGGTTPAGFDCSGFTSYVFAQAGKSIPRTATAQMFAASRVSSPQPGDLVFFGSSSYASHVGIYLGGGKMVAAPKPGDVVKIQTIYATPVAYGRF